MNEGAVNYQVLDTDYTNWAVVYTCNDFLSMGFMRQRYIWILTRSPDPSDATIAAAQAVIDAKVPNYQAWFWSIKAIQGNSWCNYKDEALIVYKTIEEK